MERLVVHVDGGARGNPGPAAIAAVLTTPEGEVLESERQVIGRATNNVAEYEALLLGIERAKALGASEVELVANVDRHVAEAHPDLVGKVAPEDILATAKEA